MKKQILKVGVIAALVFGFSLASAHVSVKPAEVGIGVRQTFTVGVPTEGDMPTIGVRLVIPEGLKSVTPYVKPGWKIAVKKTGTGEDAVVTEINWTGGSIPAGQRDDFLFTAQAPASETKLVWRAYQTYQGGQIVAWDTNPATIKAGHDENTPQPKPYSETKVINDLKATTTVASSGTKSSNATGTTLGIVSLVLSIVAIGIAKRKQSANS